MRAILGRPERWGDMLNRGIRHLVAGGAGSLLYILLVAFFVEIAQLHPVTSVVIAFAIMEVYVYAINRVWVYLPLNGHAYAIPRFLTVTAVSLALNSGIMFLAVEVLDLWYFWALLITALIVPPTNFLLNYFWAFK